MWRERIILVDGFNKDIECRVELVEDITHRFYVNRCPVHQVKPDYSKEVQNDEVGSSLWSRLMSEKLELF